MNRHLTGGFPEKLVWWDASQLKVLVRDDYMIIHAVDGPLLDHKRS